MFELIYIFMLFPLSLSHRFPYSLSSAFPASRPFLSITHKEEAKGVRETTKETRRKSRSAEGEREP